MPKPGFNPNNHLHLQRMYKAITHSRSKQEDFRANNTLSNAHVAGSHFGKAGEQSGKVPVNLMELAFTIYKRHLAGGEPRVHITSQYRNLRPYALDFELAMTDLFRQIKFQQALHLAIGNALLSIGIVKVGVEAGENIEEYSELPFVNSIGLDDWVHDMTARDWGNVQYMGNRYSLPLDVVKETREFSKKVTSELSSTDAKALNEDGSPRVQSLATGQSSFSEDGRIHECVDLWDIWLPLDRMLITIDADMLQEKPLRVLEFDDEGDPFETLVFGELQDNTMGVAPGMVWQDLHTLANNIFNKLENQARNARNVTAFQGVEGSKIADALADTGDGGAINIPPGMEPRPIKTNEIDQTSLLFLIQVKDLFSYLGGNLDALGGLGPQSPTLGQDELLLSGASQRLAEMQYRSNNFIGRIARTLAKYEITGTADRMLSKRIKGTEIEVPVQWNSRRRKAMGPIEKYQIELNPYSTAGTTPGRKLQGMVNVFNTFILPLIPHFQSLGYNIEPTNIIEDLARLSNMPELEGWITQGMVPLDQTEGQNSSPKASQTTRKYERINRSQSTSKTKDAATMQLLMGKQSQPGETGRLLGATG